MATQRLTRITHEGQVTLPDTFRERHALRDGDLVAIVETEDGVLITSREAVASRMLDQIGATLREHGLMLDDLIESGRELRSDPSSDSRDLQSSELDG